MDILRPSNWKLWIVICLVFKLVQGYFLLSGLETTRGQHYVMSGDSEYYYKLANNLLKDEGYWLWRRHIFPEAIRDIEWDKDPNSELKREYVFRMPGYAVVLFPWLQVLGVDSGLNFVVFLQLLFSAISAYLLAHLVYLLTKSRWAFAVFLLMYLLSAYVSKFAFFIMSESLSISLLIITLHFGYVVSTRGKASSMMFLLMGFAMMMAIFMRPFFIPFFGLITLYMGYTLLKRPRGILKIVLFILPILVAETFWVIRNYRNTGEIILLESSTNYAKNVNKTFQEWNNFVVKSGENWLFWEEGSLSAWILPDHYFQYGNEPATDKILPDWLREDEGLMQVARAIKADYATCLDRSIPVEERLKLQNRNIERVKRLTNEIKERFPYKYYIGSKLKIFYKFITEKTDMSYRSMKFPSNVVYSFIGPAINYFVEYFCFFMILVLLVIYRGNLLKLDYTLLTILFIPLFVAIMFSMVYGMADPRHLTYAYPFLLFGGTYTLHEMFGRNKKMAWAFTSIGAIVFLATGIHTLLYYINW